MQQSAFSTMQPPAPSPSCRVRVAINAPVDGQFDYLTAKPVAPGSRVKVRFGFQPSVVGVVSSVVADDEPLPAGVRELRPVNSVIDDVPLIPDDVLDMIRFASGYWHHPIGEVAALALPARLRKGEPARLIKIFAWQITDKGRETLAEGPKGNAMRRHEVLEILQDGQLHTRDDFIGLTSSWREVIRRMKRAGLVETVELTSSKTGKEGFDPGFTLTDEQDIAVNTISAYLGGYKPILLDGSTGSGKTEVYLRVAREVIDQGKQVLVLVPEIGLTPQIVARFRERFGQEEAVILHSGLTDKERADAWLRARAGIARIVVGTRSAVWTPMCQIGMIFVDEEHDRSFKQQEGCRYNARDLAIFRARQINAPIVLGSATPSIETMNHALTGTYEHLRLTERTGSAGAPTIRLVDTAGVKGAFSPPAIKAIGETLGRGEQVLVFLNRRGYSPVLMCSECGEVSSCPSCDHKMTVHERRNKIECHWCAHHEPVPNRCKSCGNPNLIRVGHGTERLDESLSEAFPDYPVLRFDTDTTRTRSSFESRLAIAREGGEPCILVGTQMLAKGHDLPNLTLVVVIDVDGALFSPEIRAQEFLAQTLVQVAGRSGRAEKAGLVLVQTRLPDHRLLNTSLFSGYHAALDDLLLERRQAGLPPFVHMALLHFSSPDPVECERFGKAARAAISPPKEVRISAPMPGIRARVAGRWRHYFVLESKNRQALHQALHFWLSNLRSIRRKRGLRWSVDVDPYEMS